MGANLWRRIEVTKSASSDTHFKNNPPFLLNTFQPFSCGPAYASFHPDGRGTTTHHISPTLEAIIAAAVAQLTAGPSAENSVHGCVEVS